MSMEDFNKLDTMEVDETKVNDKKAAKKEKKDKVIRMMKETVASDPDFKERLHKFSANVEVVNSLGFGDGGNIVVDGKKENGERNLVKTSKIIGYAVRNNGDQPIPYITEEFAKNEEGVWVGQKVDKVLGPGETINLSRKWMTVFASQPEISFVLANGKIVRGPATNKAGKEDIDKELEAHYFAFDDKDKKVNDDTVKKNVGKKGKDATGKQAWVVKAEYEKEFGFLNNVKEKAERKAKEKQTITATDAMANYIRLITQEGRGL